MSGSTGLLHGSQQAASYLMHTSLCTPSVQLMQSVGETHVATAWFMITSAVPKPTIRFGKKQKSKGAENGDFKF